jgi:hypothetical protein
MEEKEKPAKDIAKKINEDELKDKSKEELLSLVMDLRKENLSNRIIIRNILKILSKESEQSKI